MNLKSLNVILYLVTVFSVADRETLTEFELWAQIELYKCIKLRIGSYVGQPR